ncbi:unnamed protein product [Discosporangium mesarthrocarpum]
MSLDTASANVGATENGGGSRTPRVLGLGSAGVDFIALLESRYPVPDSKVRAQSLEVMGGGNCGNTLVALSRLGLDAAMITKVGSDTNGRLILDEFRSEGVDVSRVIVSDATPSAFTYIIVDQEEGTRTCIHTPQTEDTLPEEVTPDLLEGVSLVHLDSRHTPAAITLARLANERGIPVVLDAEKDRPFFRELLPLADYLICNRGFPQTFTGRSSREEAMEELLLLGRAKAVVSTLGAEGCIVLYREGSPPWKGFKDLHVPPSCSVRVREEELHQGPAEVQDDCSISSLLHSTPSAVRVVRSSSWAVDPSSIVDTTGAGDAFIAAFICGVVHRLGLGRLVALASLVAARKLSKAGARAGVLKWEQIVAEYPELEVNWTVHHTS